MSYFEIIVNGVSKYLADLWGWQGVRALAIILTAVLAYLIGSVCCSVMITRRLAPSDTSDGDMVSCCGFKSAAFAFAGDFLKGILAAALGLFLFGCVGGYVAALFAVIGDAFPIFFRFKGGKGFAALFGAALVFNSNVFFVLALLAVALSYVSKYLSLGVIMASAVWPLLLFRWGSIGGLLIGFGNAPVVVGTCVLLAFVTAMFVVVLYRKNLIRLLKGSEPKFDLKHPHKHPEE